MSESHQREAAIFDAALQLPADQRMEYLDHACGDDAALRQRVEALLKACDRTTDFLDEPVAPVAPVERSAPAEKSGDTIGRYKLLQQIGEGGCGVVYMAEQEEPVRRRVALKVIKLGMDTKSVIARFEAERQALAMMDHPNIAKVLDAGATDTGRPYFVMELVRGVRITDYCDQNNLSTADRLDLFMQVCRAIQHAHQKGIIHRDIKPSNILVTLHDGVPVPKVIDFGIAKATQGRLTDKTLFTAFEQFIGTPAYTSPEQAEMSGIDIDTRSDIYSLGVLLYELLTGKTPFEAKDLLAAGLDEMRRTIREKEPERPSTRLSTMLEGELTTTATRRGTEPPKLMHLVRGDLDWIVMRCLEKDRTRRYETASGLASDIQRHLSQEPVTACPPSNSYRFRKLVRRNKLAFAAGVSVAAALLIGLGVSTWMFVLEREAKREQTHLRQEAQTEAARSAQVAQFMRGMLSGVGPSVALGRDTKMLREILDQTAQSLNELESQPGVEADLRATLGNVYYDLGEYVEAAAMHRQALSIRKNLLSDEHPDVANSLSDLGKALYRLRQETEAESLHRQALAMRRRMFGNTNAGVAASLFELAEVLKERERTRTEAEQSYREAQVIWARLPGHELEVAKALIGLGKVLEHAGKPRESEQSLREAVSIQRRLLSGTHPDLAYSLSTLGRILAKFPGKLAEAETNLLEALAIQKKVLGDHRDTVWSLDALGLLRLRQGRPTEAETVQREALATHRKVLGEHAPEDEGKILLSLGRALKEQARFAEAEDAWRQALAIRWTIVGGDDGAAILAQLVELLHKEGKLAEVKSICFQAAERGSPLLNSAAWFLATCRDSEFPDGQCAVEFAEKAVVATNRKNAGYLDTLAAAYAEAGQFEKAVAVQKEAIALNQKGAFKEELAAHLKLYESNSPCREAVAP